MVDVLYDYQLALSLANENAKDGNLAELEYRYTQAVFRKHKIKSDEFDLSLAHYARNSKQMLDITNKVSKRLSDDVENSKDMHTTPNGVKTDTTVIWENRKGILLTANGRNHHMISLDGSQVIKCDRLMFGFKSSWLSQEGNKTGCVILSVKFDNDSTASRNDMIRQYDKSQGVSITIPEGRKVKDVKVYLHQSGRWFRNPQVLSISDLALWGIRTSSTSGTK